MGWGGAVAVSMFGERKSDEDGLAFAHYVKCVPSLDKIEEDLICACLQWATSSSGEKKDVEGRGRKAGDLAVSSEWSQVIQFQKTVRTVHMVGSK